jgi:hypothetical protein
LPYVCLAPAELCCHFIPVSISAVSLTDRQNVNSKRRFKEFKMYRKGKYIRKKRRIAAFVFVPSVFGEKFPKFRTAEF